MTILLAWVQAFHKFSPRTSRPSPDSLGVPCHRSLGSNRADQRPCGHWPSPSSPWLKSGECLPGLRSEQAQVRRLHVLCLHVTECRARTRLQHLFLKMNINLTLHTNVKLTFLIWSPEFRCMCVWSRKNVAFIVQGQFLIIKKENYQWSQKLLLIKIFSSSLLLPLPPLRLFLLSSPSSPLLLFSLSLPSTGNGSRASSMQSKR